MNKTRKLNPLVRSVVGIVVLSIFSPVSDNAFSADNRDRFKACEFNGADGHRLQYRLLKPKDDVSQGETYPLVLLLHGAGERGDDNRRQLFHGANEIASDPIVSRYPCFVVVPQCPDGDQWVDTPWSADSHTTPPKPARPLQLALDLISELETQLPVDPQRIYITGLSMGGFGAWDAMVRQPDRFAAAVIICGGGDTAAAGKIAHIPVWVFHGDQDGAVKTQRSRDMVRALKNAGGSPKYTEYPNTGHDSWTATYRNPEMYAWLFGQRKPPAAP